jgi:hypothetical protein
MLKILKNYESWYSVEGRAIKATDEEKEKMEEIIWSVYPDGIDDAEITDEFWHDTLNKYLGIK